MIHRAWSSIGDCPIVFQGHPSNFKVSRGKNRRFWPKFCPDCSFILISQMAMKWCTHLKAAEMCPIVFEGHPSNFQVTGDKNSQILTQIGRFRTVTLVWFHRWLCNDAQSRVTIGINQWMTDWFLLCHLWLSLEQFISSYVNHALRHLRRLQANITPTNTNDLLTRYIL